MAVTRPEKGRDTTVTTVVDKDGSEGQLHASDPPGSASARKPYVTVRELVDKCSAAAAAWSGSGSGCFSRIYVYETPDSSFSSYSPPMSLSDPPFQPSSGHLLDATWERLRSRRDDLAPPVAEYDRIERICAAIGELPEGTDGTDDADEGSPGRELSDVVRHLHETRTALQAWMTRLEPLVLEYEQILHVLPAFDSAHALPRDAGAVRRRSRGGRGHQKGRNGASPGGQAQLDALRALLAEPRSRADLGDRMGLSPSRVTELLEPLTRAGEVIETRDAERPSRKLWVLLSPGAHGERDGEGSGQPENGRVAEEGMVP